MLKQFTIILFFVAVAIGLQAQPEYPKSNLYLFKVNQEDDGSISFTEPRYLTAFNSEGFNNDPFFFSNTELYISVKEPGATQSDLYKLDLENQTKLRVTETPEPEFVPARMPEYYTFSAVRTEKDGQEDVYRLWQFPIDQLTNGKPVFKYLSGIKDYLWLNSREIAIYKEEDPTTLSIVNTANDDLSLIHI